MTPHIFRPRTILAALLFLWGVALGALLMWGAWWRIPPCYRFATDAGLVMQEGQKCRM